MIVGAGAAARAGAPRLSVSRARWLASMVVCVVLPAAVLVAVLADEVLRSGAGYDFQVDLDAARALLHHGTPYTPIDDAVIGAGKQYVYPPLTAIALVPLTVLPSTVAGLLAMLGLAAAVVAIPLVLGVRDLRCIGLLFLWPPVVQGIQTSNVAILLVLGVALLWRFRDRARPAGLALGCVFAVKLAFGPLVVWLAATRRLAAAAWSVGLAAALLLGSWAVIGFDGLAGYPTLLRHLGRAMDARAYSLYAVLVDLGASSTVARLVWLGAGSALLVWAVVVARRRDDRRSFVLAVAAAVALSPIVWLESFVALAVILSLTRPRLAAVWFVPLAMWVTGGSHDPTQFERVGTLVVAAVTVALALLPDRALAPGRRAHELVREAV